MLWNFNYIQKIDYDTKQEHQKSENQQSVLLEMSWKFQKVRKFKLEKLYVGRQEGKTTVKMDTCWIRTSLSNLQAVRANHYTNWTYTLRDPCMITKKSYMIPERIPKIILFA